MAARACTRDVVTATQGQTAWLRTEVERVRARYPLLGSALLAGTTAGAAVLALLVWNGARAKD
jgi:hypothetical protein